jgi:hypothetical protein
MTPRLTMWIGNPTIRLIATLAIALFVAACGPGNGSGGNGGY